MPTDEEIIRDLVEYADSDRFMTAYGVRLTAYQLVQIMLDVDHILQARNPRKLLDSMDRLSDAGND